MCSNAEGVNASAERMSFSYQSNLQSPPACRDYAKGVLVGGDGDYSSDLSNRVQEGFLHLSPQPS